MLLVLPFLAMCAPGPAGLGDTSVATEPLAEAAVPSSSAPFLNDVIGPIDSDFLPEFSVIGPSLPDDALPEFEDPEASESVKSTPAAEAVRMHERVDLLKNLLASDKVSMRAFNSRKPLKSFIGRLTQ